MNSFLQYAGYLGVLVALAWPLGAYITRVMNGEKAVLNQAGAPLERLIYKFFRINPRESMSWKKYLWAVLGFSVAGFIFTFIIQITQSYLIGNPEHLPNVPWDLAFNTAASYVTNTNWQAYAGESTLSYLTQALCLTVQNFVSAATGIAVLFALARGIIAVRSANLAEKNSGLGSFWVDITRCTLYVLIPLNVIVATALIAGGVVQNNAPSTQAELLEPVSISQVEGGAEEVITHQYIPGGPAASQVAIKQTGTNGGGFFGANSAHPLENPNAFTNMVEMLGILIIPVALCFSFGQSIRNKKQGRTLFIAMFVLLVAALAAIAVSESQGMLAAGGIGGNMEGKEIRFGIPTSATWAAFTTAASSGSVNAMADSFTPLGGMVMMIQMQLGEVIFGGVGSGLYGMIAFAILVVFIAGLMVGRSPEFLGKKIEPYEMKWAVVVCLATPVAILVGSAIAAGLPHTQEYIGNTGSHAFSELLYTYTSGGANNGSAFAGYSANNVFTNISVGLCMIFARFVPILGTLAIAGNLSKKKTLATTAGTLSTTNFTFVFLLIFIILLVGALSFFPALALGPLAEFFTNLR